MTLSRTARILIALLLVAAAVFVWINFFQNAPDTTTPATPTVTQPAQPGAEEDTATPGQDGAPAVTVAPDGSAPTVVTTPSDAVVGRDVEVAEFPFLVDQPPPAEAAAETQETTEAGAGRPGGDARASINPFSPIVLPAAPSVAQASAAAPSGDAGSSPAVQTVDVPSAPEVETVAAEVPVPAAPAPRALAPAGVGTSSLPRPLATGTLPVAPDVLTSTRAERETLAPIDLPDRTAIREPDAPLQATPLPALADAPREAGAEPTPLGPGEVPEAGTPDQPLVAGADSLARYLRDRNVAFTGSVVGSVGVGVFRVSGASAPIILALGQSLPDTEIVLTDLRGRAAEFTLDDTTHVLSLDLRR